MGRSVPETRSVTPLVIVNGIFKVSGYGALFDVRRLQIALLDRQIITLFDLAWVWSRCLHLQLRNSKGNTSGSRSPASMVVQLRSWRAVTRVQLLLLVRRAVGRHLDPSLNSFRHRIVLEVLVLKDPKELGSVHLNNGSGQFGSCKGRDSTTQQFDLILYLFSSSKCWLFRFYCVWKPQARFGQGRKLMLQRASYGGRVVAPVKTMQEVPSRGRMKEEATVKPANLKA